MLVVNLQLKLIPAITQDYLDYLFFWGAKCHHQNTCDMAKYFMIRNDVL